MPTQITYNQLLIIGAIFGIVLGLVPLILGFRKQKKKMGIIGFISAVAVGIPFSFLGALPVAIIFIWLILRNPVQKVEVVNDNPIDVPVETVEKSSDTPASDA